MKVIKYICIYIQTCISCNITIWGYHHLHMYISTYDYMYNIYNIYIYACQPACQQEKCRNIRCLEYCWKFLFHKPNWISSHPHSILVLEWHGNWWFHINTWMISYQYMTYVLACVSWTGTCKFAIHFHVYIQIYTLL
jgi:hypothetical protein